MSVQIQSKQKRKLSCFITYNPLIKHTTGLLNLAEELGYYNHHRTHQGKMCCGRTPMETLLDGKRIWAEKHLSSN